MPDGFDRELGTITTQIQNMIKLHEQHQQDVEGLEKRLNEAEMERRDIKTTVSGLFTQLLEVKKEIKGLGTDLTQKVDNLTNGFNRLAAQPRLSEEARSWVHEEHGKHLQRRQADLHVEESRRASWNWLAVLMVAMSFLTLVVLVLSVFHHG